jgi:alginate export protein
VRFLLLLYLTVCVGICQTADRANAGAQDGADSQPPAAQLVGTHALDFSPALEVNRHLPSWIQLRGEFRVRGESDHDIRFGTTTDTHILSRLRLGVTIAPATWLSFDGEAQDSRIFLNGRLGPVPPYQNTWDVRQAYVALRDPDRQWVELKIGRQNLSFGKEWLIGPSDWQNMGRTFDAVRLDIHHPGYRISLFASSVIIARDGVIDHHLAGNNLHGIYTSFDKLIPHATIEPYVLWRVAPGGIHLNENAGRGALNEVTAGLRWAGTLPSHFDYEMEMDRQTGSLGSNSIRAWAGHWNIGRAFPLGDSSVRPFAEANYASGTDKPNSGIWGTFDPIYPSSHDKLGFADQIASFERVSRKK